jgi:hypothetical protein
MKTLMWLLAVVVVLTAARKTYKVFRARNGRGQFWDKLINDAGFYLFAAVLSFILGDYVPAAAFGISLLLFIFAIFLTWLEERRIRSAFKR